MRVIALLSASCVAFGQNAPSFEVASVKRSKAELGRDGTVTSNPGRLTVRNATVKRLIFEAYQVPFSQIAGGPAWIESEEYDIDAKSEFPVGPDQLRLMLRTLLTDRFRLAIHRENKERPVYGLVVAKGGARLHADETASSFGRERFHGNLDQFADRLSTWLTIPISDDPTTPSRARGAPVPVLNQTGIKGIFDFSVTVKYEPGVDSFNFWQRALQEQLGLKLESRKARVEIIVIDSAEKAPTEN